MKLNDILVAALMAIIAGVMIWDWVARRMRTRREAAEDAAFDAERAKRVKAKGPHAAPLKRFRFRLIVDQEYIPCSSIRVEPSEDGARHDAKITIVGAVWSRPFGAEERPSIFERINALADEHRARVRRSFQIEDDALLAEGKATLETLPSHRIPMIRAEVVISERDGRDDRRVKFQIRRVEEVGGISLDCSEDEVLTEAVVLHVVGGDDYRRALSFGDQTYWGGHSTLMARLSGESKAEASS